MSGERSITIPDPAGVEDAATVCVSMTAGDDDDTHQNVTSILINGSVDLGVDQAEAVAESILETVRFLRLVLR